MNTKKQDKSITQLLGSIAAAQTMVEEFPYSFGIDEYGFTCTFDLLTTIFNLVSPEPLKVKIITWLTDKLSDSNDTWLQKMEETIKLAIELNLTSLLSCDMSPIIPDKLIGCGEFLENTDRELNFSGEGITIPLSAIDFTGLLNYCPTDETNILSTMQYMTCFKSEESEELLGVDELWKHDDFNAFLWYVKNKGIYNNTVERQKLIWDNRYKTIPFSKPTRRPEEFFTMKKGYDSLFDAQNKQEGIFPFSKTYLKNYNNHPDTTYKKRQILEVRYIDGDGIKSDSFQFHLPASNYYKTRRLGGTDENAPLKFNKTIFEFNHDFLMSLKLFDLKTYIAQVMNNLLGVGNISIGLSLTRDKQELDALINGIIEKVINLSDINVDDCYFTFSNEEYDEMIKKYQEKSESGEQYSDITIESLEQIKLVQNTNTTIDAKQTAISNILTQAINEANGKWDKSGEWKLNWTDNFDFEFIRALAYPFIRALFSPKVMTLILINLEVMGNPLKIGEKMLTFNDIKPYFMGIITNIIVQIKDMINELLYTWVIEKLSPILTEFTLRLTMEQIEMYRNLINDLVNACLINIKFPKKKRKGEGIDEVDYVDIEYNSENIKETPNAKNNC